MVKGELLFRTKFIYFLNSSTNSDIPNYSTCSWCSIEDYLHDFFKSKIEINVGEHWSSSNLAWFSPSEPLVINLNIDKMYRTEESIAGSIAHEYVHLVDYHVKHESFGHPPMRFWRKRKVLNSAPYIIGRDFKRYLEDHF